jgi:hypothetical protein
MTVNAQIVRTRRSFLGAALGAAAAGLASAIARPSAALATTDDGSVIHVGDQKNAVTTTTLLKNQGLVQTVLWVELEPTIDIPQSDSAAAIVGISSATYGVGVSGHAATGTGVIGSSGKGTGVQAICTGSGFGLEASCDDNIGVYSTSANGIAVNASGGEIGVLGFSRKQVGVRGESIDGRGALFIGGPAQIRLAPSSDPTHPGSGKAGDLFVDKSHRLWFCKGGTIWVKLA